MFPFLSIQYDFLTAVAFFDATNLWGVGFSSGADEQSFNFNDTLISYGLGLRFNLGGLMVLRWDFPFKHEDGMSGTFFSIGLDY